MSSNAPAAADFYLRTKAVQETTGLSRTTIHRMVKSGDFPSPKRLGVRAVGWLSSDLARWREGRPMLASIARPHRPLPKKSPPQGRTCDGPNANALSSHPFQK